MTKQQATRRVTKQKVALMNDSRTVMFSAVLMACLFHVVDKDHKIKTGATDGLNIYLNIEFIRKLTDAQLRYLIMHEVMHVAFKHMTVWRALFLKCAMSTNLATDNVINLTMKYEIDPSQKFLQPIEGGICDDKYYQGGRVLDTRKGEEMEKPLVVTLNRVTKTRAVAVKDRHLMTICGKKRRQGLMTLINRKH